MKGLPYFKWYPADAETESHYSSLTDAELGFYHRLLNKSWINCGLPSDQAELARLMKVSPGFLKKIWLRVGKKFVVSEDSGRLVNPRQEAERSLAIRKSEQSADAGRKRHSSSAGAERIRSESSASGQPRVLARAGSDSDFSGKGSGENPDPNFTENDVGYWIERLYSRHPKKKNLPLVHDWCAQAWVRFSDPVEQFREIDRVHELWCRTDDWQKKNGNFAPKLDEWLGDKGWSKRPVLDDGDGPVEDGNARRAATSKLKGDSWI